MSTIPVVDARSVFTKTLVEVYRERIRPMSFLRSFFPTKETMTKNVSIEVERGTEKVAVDVERGTDGNRNSFTKSTEKIFEPPLYREYFDLTHLDLYDRAFGSTNSESSVISALIDESADRLSMLQYKIERAYEKQCSEVLETGIVTVAAGVNINFKRKAASLVDKGAGNYWATGTVNPYTDLENAAKFLRQTGKSQGGTLNVIMGSTALQHFLTNDIVEARADVRNFRLDDIRQPQRDSVGASLHGQVSAGAWTFNIWTYPEYFDNASGVSTPYINDKKIVILPESPRFKLVFGAVPQLITPGGRIQTGAFLVREFRDDRQVSHIIDIASAGIAIPVAVDQIYTLQVVA